nr:hypothetical protein GCM10020093_109330 [Planobispora longispora]
MSTAVISSRRSGHSFIGSRSPIVSILAPVSGTASAISPTRRRASRGSREGSNRIPKVAMTASMSTAGTVASVSDSACAATALSRSAPVATRVPTTDPAEVPTIRSATPRSRPARRRPVRTPASHAIPATPPPPSTSALVMRPILT